MAGESEEVGPEGLDVHRRVRNQLGAVDQDHRPHLASQAGDLVHRWHGAQHVGHSRYRHHLDPLVEPFASTFHIEPETVCQLHVAQFRPGVAGDDVPGHDIGVMLHHAGQDPITRLEVVEAPSVREQVHRRGGAAGEDDLLVGRCVQEDSHLVAGRLVGLGGLVREGVGAPMDVGIGVAVDVPHRIENLHGLL